MTKKSHAIDSKEGIADLVKFFQEKFSSLSKKEIKEQIEESLSDSGRYSSYGTCFSVTVDGEEFNLIPSFDEFHDIAIDYVTQMLEDEPELFTPSFIENHLSITDTDKRILAGEEAEAYTGHLSDREVEKEFERKNNEVLYVDGDEDDPDYDAMREALYDDHYDYVYGELENDPVGYFEQMGYSKEDIYKHSLFSLDVEEAAKEAVSVDGEAHFLSHYDGNYEETDNGIIVMKE